MPQPFEVRFESENQREAFRAAAPDLRVVRGEHAWRALNVSLTGIQFSRPAGAGGRFTRMVVRLFRGREDLLGTVELSLVRESAHRTAARFTSLTQTQEDVLSAYIVERQKLAIDAARKKKAEREREEAAMAAAGPEQASG